MKQIACARCGYRTTVYFTSDNKIGFSLDDSQLGLMCNYEIEQRLGSRQPVWLCPHLNDAIASLKLSRVEASSRLDLPTAR